MRATLANILDWIWRILLVSGKWSDIRDFLCFSTKKFPSEIVLEGLAKDQPQIVQISCNICAFVKHVHYPQYLFRYLCFYGEFIMQIPGKCLLHNFYYLLLLKISKLIKLLL